MRNPRYVLAVPDLERSARFYRDILGFEVHVVGDPGWRYCRRNVRVKYQTCPVRLAVGAM